MFSGLSMKTAGKQRSPSSLGSIGLCLLMRSRTGRFLLVASSSSILGAQITTLSQSFLVVAAEATRLHFMRDPSRYSFTYRPFEEQPIVEFVDEYGNLVLSISSLVLLTVVSTKQLNAGFPKLVLGRSSVSALRGVAAFSDLAVDLASRDAYRLMASSDGMLSAQSAEFFVYAAADGVAQLIFQTEPPLTVEIGAELVPMPIVITADADGRRVYNSTLVVSLSIDPASSLNQVRLVATTSAARLSVSTEDGAAEFAGVAVDSIGLGFRLLAYADGITPAVSRPFRVTSVQAPTTEYRPAFPADEGGTSSALLIGLVATGCALLVLVVAVMLWRRRVAAKNRVRSYVRKHQQEQGKRQQALTENDERENDPSIDDKLSIQLFP
jgi:hypothetical protein